MSKAQEARTGAMIALVPAETDRLAPLVRGAVPRSDLHVTLKYLGDASAWRDEDRDRVRKVAALIARPVVPVQVEAVRELGEEDGRCLVVVLRRAEDLLAYRELVLDAVDVVRDLPEKYPQYLPHITLCYQADVSGRAYEAVRTHAEGLVGMALSFPKLWVTFGSQNTFLPLEVPAWA
jgi:2'-5' RNA ligase